MPDPLEDVLKGRDERVATQKRYLSINHFICQITLNIPGYPKRIFHDEETVEAFREKFLFASPNLITDEIRLSNGAGLCWMGVFCGTEYEAVEAKKCAVALEEVSNCGRIIDIDIITASGSISRNSIGLPSRKCILCEKDAKECAREGKHSLEKLRATVIQFLNIF